MSLSLSLYIRCKHTPLYQNQIFKILVTFYNARCRGSVLLWPDCDTSCTSSFVDDIMTNSHKNPFTLPLYTIVRYMLSSCVCPSVLSQADVVSKRLNESSLFWYGSFLPLCCKEIRVSPKVRVFPAATLSQILYLTWSAVCCYT